MTHKEQQLDELLRPTIHAMGFELWGLVYNAHHKNARLVIYIDKEQGVNIEDCAEVSRQIGALMDVEDPLAGSFVLEVSSPGIERRLFNVDQVARFIGTQVAIRLREPFDGQKKFKGMILATEQDEIVLRIADEVLTLPWPLIEQAHLVYEGAVGA